MSLQDKLKRDMEANKEYAAQGSGDWFKFGEGANTVRILSNPVIMFEKYQVGICYTDCGYQGSAKYLAWVIDRKDNKMKLMKIPYGKFEEIAMLESDPDYKFSGFPMPYDITINAKGAGAKTVEYSAPLPRPPRPVDAEILAQLNDPKHLSCEKIIEKMKAKQKEKHVADGTWAKNQSAKEQLKKDLEDVRGVDDGLDTIEYPNDDESAAGARAFEN